MRHSVRPPFPPGVFHFQVDLTPEGVRLAEALGTRLGTQLISLDSSTSSRCLQTAEAIGRGSGQPVSLRANPKLGDKGVFVQIQIAIINTWWSKVHWDWSTRACVGQ